MRILFFAALMLLLCLDAACVYAAWMLFALGRDMQPGPSWLDPTTVFVAMSMATVAALVAVLATRGRPALCLLIAAGPALLMALLITLVLIVYPDG
jgi:hypothetical protein